ncbi:hypothetical protein PCANC_08244 [Puccinia coronata f. sp. avenae]|uniref:HMG box domain-containing protein n=1 Tax=Puccinia coronata f. sp. avenae TaxID=200324 RepID=A0A2N5T5S5_9BASI|nr:hypothetical protein PCANC_08244 [Puccinia coronata f. sp. avenae]PLW30071.1 hypothetical protein PCASD_17419 [Puccinia coronata f. sp. avenae]
MDSREGSVESFLGSLGLGDYLSIFLSEGFDTIQAIQEITEEDLEQMRVKRGHRRILQRALGKRFSANAPADLRLDPACLSQAPISPPPFSGEARLQSALTQRSASWDPESSHSESSFFANADRNLTPSQNQCRPTGFSQADLTSGSTAQFCLPPKPKRRYRRHPKPDLNAPKKPLSAYVMFSNTVREQLQGQQISFTEIARIVGDRWKKLDPSTKEVFEREAAEQKDRWTRSMLAYKRTREYEQYRRYLQQFKEAQQVRNSTTQPPPKRYSDVDCCSTQSMGVESECNDDSREASDVDEAGERNDITSHPVMASSVSPAQRSTDGSYPNPSPRDGAQFHPPQPARSASENQYYHLPPPLTRSCSRRPTIPNLRTLDKHLTESQTLFFKSNCSVRSTQ